MKSEQARDRPESFVAGTHLTRIRLHLAIYFCLHRANVLEKAAHLQALGFGPNTKQRDLKTADVRNARDEVQRAESIPAYKKEPGPALRTICTQNTNSKRPNSAHGELDE
jgi:hypothetical protein